ncbi:MAG TPA: SDR family NAD(P)-dependent oxidoreductase [Flavitalea sp.]|nr:SDR family NAD(P)-dependent oxidoreductase [Flavitalea sp.]
MKNVIITGANGNLGSAVVKEFLNKGYKVIATVAEEKMKATMIRHDNLEVITVNLMNEEESENSIKKVIKENGQIDAALLLVGGFTAGSIFKATTGDIYAQIALNFNTAYHVARPVFTHMMEKSNGKIVFIGSRPALEAQAGKGVIAYGLSKSMLFKLAEYMNAESHGKNVVATVIAPSTLDTESNRKSMPDADPEKWVKPSALAEILEFVVSEKASVLREPVLKVYNNA